MRPLGEIRQALRNVAPQVAPLDAAKPDAGASYLDLAAALACRGVLSLAAPAELRLVRQTVKNMVQAGELKRVGAAKAPGKRKPMGLYAATEAAGWDAGRATGHDGAAALAAAWWGGSR